MYLLDTNACIRILNGTSPSLAERLRFIPRSQLRLSSVVKAELLYGARKSSRVAENMRLLERFFDSIASLPFDDGCAEEYGLLREELERAGTPIGANDMLIAATARAHHAILVTHNVREFSRVADLRLEDWQSR
ncbi:MAG TPA: type II toxin-antitoxin system VapC family toxin [Thermoanaerobaculia bacterium]|jgi:tRNA(fMet)-specific endonuclease VapC|nr:type II toxin-antitoxin system VapC family toxin [Thermoanaerobaculia bacterium]